MAGPIVTVSWVVMLTVAPEVLCEMFGDDIDDGVP